MNTSFTEFNTKAVDPLFTTPGTFRWFAAKFWASESFKYPEIYKQSGGFALPSAQPSDAVGQVATYQCSTCMDFTRCFNCIRPITREERTGQVLHIGDYLSHEDCVSLDCEVES